MRPPLSRRPCAALITLALTTAALPAAAGDPPPKVRFIPRAELIDQALPASAPFTLEVRTADLQIDGSSDVWATLHVWPLAEQKDSGKCAAKYDPALMLRATPNQTYTLGMSANGVDGERLLSATVPALQVGQRFCFAISPEGTVDANALSYVAVAAADALIPRLAPAQDGRKPAPDITACESAATDANFSDALRVARTEYDRLLGLPARLPGAGEADIHLAATSAVRAYYGLALDAPPAAASTGDAANVEPKTTPLKPGAKADPKKPPPPAAAAPTPPSNAPAACRAFASADWNRAVAEQSAASGNPLDPSLDSRKAAYHSAFVTFEKALTAAFSTKQVHQSITLAFSAASVTARAGSGKTPDKANYASVDIGLLGAIPNGGVKLDAWALPYVGLNIYFIPVDRTIAATDLTGTAGEQFRQRVSLVIGTTLSSPSISGRAITKPLGVGNYPVVGAGVRLSQYLHLTGALVFYNLNDKNPASAGTTLHAAPAVGLGIDADIMQAFMTLVK
jgi:hypothetical protein